MGIIEVERRLAEAFRIVVLGAFISGGAFVIWGAASTARAQEGLVTYKSLTLEVAMKAAQATLDACRKAGYQVAVAVVDRGGSPQVMLRDRFAGWHTPDASVRKARTALSFHSDTIDLVEPTAAGKPGAGARHVPGTMMVGGGVRIDAAGSIVGAIGVSGAPGGDKDHACAKAGIEAIGDIINF